MDFVLFKLSIWNGSKSTCMYTAYGEPEQLKEKEGCSSSCPPPKALALARSSSSLFLSLVPFHIILNLIIYCIFDLYQTKYLIRDAIHWLLIVKEKRKCLVAEGKLLVERGLPQEDQERLMRLIVRKNQPSIRRGNVKQRKREWICKYNTRACA